MPTHDRPVFSERFDSIHDFVPEGNSVYISARSIESRSEHVEVWRDQAKSVLFADVVAEKRWSIDVSSSGQGREIALRSAKQLEAFWNDVKRETIYLDITGMRHHVWAALLRGAIRTRERVIVVYVEPKDYRPSLTPTENEIYDLSEAIEGIAPLPGFARLRDVRSETCFVPLLGFEGTRAAYLISQLEPPGGKIVPIIGLPGFRAEYPFATYHGNRRPLMETQAWKSVRYAVANCPFDAYYVLEEIAASFPSHVLRVAPIGTKPHAIGGVLFAIANPSTVELVYDHPIRKARRTDGTARLFAYHVSALFR